MKLMTIGKVALAAGVGVETIRFYERKGIVHRPPKRQGGFRYYSQEDVTRVKFTKRAQEIGFTLREAKELLDLQSKRKMTGAQVKEKATGKIQEIRAKIADLKRMEEALAKLAQVCGRSHSSSHPKFSSFESERDLGGECRCEASSSVSDCSIARNRKGQALAYCGRSALENATPRNSIFLPRPSRPPVGKRRLDVHHRFPARETYSRSKGPALTIEAPPLQTRLPQNNVLYDRAKRCGEIGTSSHLGCKRESLRRFEFFPEFLSEIETEVRENQIRSSEPPWARIVPNILLQANSL